MAVSSYTRIQELCEERERHWLRCKQILDLPATHDYQSRQLWEEGTKELVDYMNYMRALGQFSLAAKAHALAVETLEAGEED